MVFSSMIKTLLLCIVTLTLLATPSSSWPGNHILAGEQLRSGEALVEGPYQLIMQKDCNLVLYKLTEVVWTSDTKDKDSDCYLSLETNGNLVIYASDNKVIWETNTNGEVGDYVLILQYDRNVIVFGKKLWETLTHKNAPSNIVTAGAHNEISGKEKNKMRTMGKIVEVTGDE